MALRTARIHRVRGRPPLLAAGINSLIHSHSSSVRSLGYIFSFIYPFYTTREDFSDRLSGRVEVSHCTLGGLPDVAHSLPYFCPVGCDIGRRSCRHESGSVLAALGADLWSIP